MKTTSKKHGKDWVLELNNQFYLTETLLALEFIKYVFS